MKRMLPLVVIGLLVAGPAHAAEFIYKYDQFSEEIVTASSQISGAPTAVQAGYAMGEAFGQLYKPNAAHYPIKIMGLDLVLAKPPNGEVALNYAKIEIYFVDGNSANPGMDTPTFSISTSDIFNPGTGQDGIKLEGGTALRIDFDWEDVGGHPPILFEGNFLVMVRFTGPSKSLVDEWGISQCLKEFGAGLCGCQPAGTVHDGATTTGVNVLNIKLGGCEFPSTQWSFAESLGLTGDIVMRVRATVAGTGTCSPNCGSNECGPDGCGGSCGNCPTGQDCVSGQCQGGTCTPNCGSNQCGNDGCGGSCGTCNPGEGCINGQCVVGTCTPECGDATCGDDGCGGSCGSCDGGQTCVNGLCVQNPTPGALTLLGISPDWGYPDELTEVSITGQGLGDVSQALLGGTTLSSVNVVGDGLITAIVPKGLEPGLYQLIVATANGDSAFLTDAFEVQERESVVDVETDSGGGCATGPAGATTCVLIGLALLSLAWRRRRA